MLLIGNVIGTFGIGATKAPIQRYIQEYLPEKYIGPVFALTNLTVQLSVLIGSLSVFVLPPDKDKEALEIN